jgi:hypothetical protein
MLMFTVNNTITKLIIDYIVLEILIDLLKLIIITNYFQRKTPY